MSLDSDIQLLSRVKLFAGFKPDHLRLLAFGAEARTLGQGTKLYAEGDSSDGGYVIVRGGIDLVTGSDNRLLSSHTTGALIGEMALITDTTRPATALASENTEVLKISRPLFRRMLSEYPELAHLLHERISDSTKGFVEKLVRIKAKLDHASDVTERRLKAQLENSTSADELASDTVKS